MMNIYELTGRQGNTWLTNNRLCLDAGSKTGHMLVQASHNLHLFYAYFYMKMCTFAPYINLEYVWDYEIPKYRKCEEYSYEAKDIQRLARLEATKEG